MLFAKTVKNKFYVVKETYISLGVGEPIRTFKVSWTWIMV